MRRFVFLAVLAATLAPAAIASAESPAEKQLAQKIGSHLKQSGQLRSYRVGVKYHDGVAYLAGTVTSAEQRDIAVRLAQQVDGVSHVVSKIEYPMDGESESGDIQEPAGNSRQAVTNELNRASFEGAQNDASNVMQAYEQPPMQQQGGGFQQNQMAQGQGGRSFAPQQMRRNNMPMPAGRLPGMMPMRPNQGAPSNIQQASCNCNGGGGGMGGMGMGMGGPAPSGFTPQGSGGAPAYDNPQMPGYAWPSYAAYPNYAAIQYPQQYSPTAWPYIGPFYPYPQVPLAWRKVSLEWDDGWWFLDFSAHNSSH